MMEVYVAWGFSYLVVTGVGVLLNTNSDGFLEGLKDTLVIQLFLATTVLVGAGLGVAIIAIIRGLG